MISLGSNSEVSIPGTCWKKKLVPAGLEFTLKALILCFMYSFYTCWRYILNFVYLLKIIDHFCACWIYKRIFNNPLHLLNIFNFYCTCWTNDEKLPQSFYPVVPVENSRTKIAHSICCYTCWNTRWNIYFLTMSVDFSWRKIHVLLTVHACTPGTHTVHVLPVE